MHIIFIIDKILKLLLWLLYYVIITTIINGIVMGALHVRLSLKCKNKKFAITKTNRFEMQSGNQCADFAAAYLLRHLDIEKDGDRLYEVISNKMKDGCVRPKGILKLLSQYGFQAKYCVGNITALKKEVSKGSPVIVLIRTWKNQNWLHFVPVVGYDENYIYIAESLKELINCNERYYNRKIAVGEFRKLWNTSMWKMPCYRDTYILVKQRKQKSNEKA